MPSAPFGPSIPQKATNRVRLDSWKEIADYLGRGERTAKRWESQRALPVHHVPGGGHGSVYAFTAELDEWLLSEKPKDHGPSPDSAKPSGTNTDITVAGTPLAPSSHSAMDPTNRGTRWLWRIPAYLLLLITLSLAVAYFVNLRTINANTSSILRSLLERTKSKSTSALSNPEKQLAHDLYLRGRFEWDKRTPESLSRALDYFTQSIVHDPGNAQAYVGLADSYNLMREYALMPENEAYARGIAAAKKAIELDDSLAEAHRSLAFDEIWGNWDFQAGEKEFQRAIELNPRDPLTHLWFANAFASPDWYPICLREIDRTQELDPASHAILADKGLLLFHSGQRERGLELVKQVEHADPEFLSPHRYLASMYLTLDDYPGFLAESERTAELSHDQVLKETNAASRAGFRREGARGLFHDLYVAQKKFYVEGKLEGTYVAKTCIRLGNKKEALRLLRDDFEKHRAPFLMARESLDLLTLKDEPEFQELLEKIHCRTPP